jgi:hypothetical protein
MEQRQRSDAVEGGACSSSLGSASAGERTGPGAAARAPPPSAPPPAQVRWGDPA